MPKTPHPLSDLVNQLQSLSHTKDDVLFTGSSFQDEYTAVSDPEEKRNQIAFAGGDIQTAYANLSSAYQIAKNANDDNRNPHKIKGDAETSLNPQVVSGNMKHAEDALTSAINRFEQYDVGPVNQLKTLRARIIEHRKLIENTGSVVVE